MAFMEESKQTRAGIGLRVVRALWDLPEEGIFCELCGGENDRHLDGCRGRNLDDLVDPFYCRVCGEELTNCTCPS
jgi:hypothetical protein